MFNKPNTLQELIDIIKDDNYKGFICVDKTKKNPVGSFNQKNPSTWINYKEAQEYIKNNPNAVSSIVCTYLWEQTNAIFIDIDTDSFNDNNIKIDEIKSELLPPLIEVPSLSGTGRHCPIIIKDNNAPFGGGQYITKINSKQKYGRGQKKGGIDFFCGGDFETEEQRKKRQGNGRNYHIVFCIDKIKEQQLQNEIPVMSSKEAEDVFNLISYKLTGEYINSKQYEFNVDVSKGDLQAKVKELVNKGTLKKGKDINNDWGFYCPLGTDDHHKDLHANEGKNGHPVAFFINKENGMYGCFRCKKGGSFISLLQQFGEPTVGFEKETKVDVSMRVLKQMIDDGVIMISADGNNLYLLDTENKRWMTHKSEALKEAKGDSGYNIFTKYLGDNGDGMSKRDKVDMMSMVMDMYSRMPECIKIKGEDFNKKYIEEFKERPTSKSLLTFKDTSGDVKVYDPYENRVRDDIDANNLHYTPAMAHLIINDFEAEKMRFELVKKQMEENGWDENKVDKVNYKYAVALRFIHSFNPNGKTKEFDNVFIKWLSQSLKPPLKSFQVLLGSKSCGKTDAVELVLGGIWDKISNSQGGFARTDSTIIGSSFSLLNDRLAKRQIVFVDEFDKVFETARSLMDKLISVVSGKRGGDIELKGMNPDSAVRIANLITTANVPPYQLDLTGDEANTRLTTKDIFIVGTPNYDKMKSFALGFLNGMTRENETKKKQTELVNDLINAEIEEHKQKHGYKYERPFDLGDVEDGVDDAWEATISIPILQDEDVRKFMCYIIVVEGFHKLLNDGFTDKEQAILNDYHEHFIRINRYARYIYKKAIDTELQKIFKQRGIFGYSNDDEASMEEQNGALVHSYEGWDLDYNKIEKSSQYQPIAMTGRIGKKNYEIDFGATSLRINEDNFDEFMEQIIKVVKKDKQKKDEFQNLTYETRRSPKNNTFIVKLIEEKIDVDSIPS